MATASAVSPSPSPSPSLSSSSSTPLQFSTLLEANTYRLKAIVERLTYIIRSKGGASAVSDSSEFFNLCIALARGVDYALTINDVPGVAPRLPSLIKQVYQRSNESHLQPAIMVLMITLKNACKYGWFTTSDADELLNMTKELFSTFCMTMNVTPTVGNAHDIISKLISRFYPQFKLSGLLHSVEAKPGYEILISDFQIPRNRPSEEKIMLIVTRTDNLETSSCIISPPHVSFLVNGKGVDRRTNVSLDNGPQFPTDITRMLKYGTNIFQAIGYFTGTYLIALAFMSKITLPDYPVLQDYVQPTVTKVLADSEIVEGGSRITLNCPISFKRLKVPVKGHLCNHHQCFDYNNFMEMNSRKPSWRCPCCNQPVGFIDLRIDQNMVEILKEVEEHVNDIVISADGSWKVVAEHKGQNDQLHKENLTENNVCNIKSSSTVGVNRLIEAVDLTIEEDGDGDSQTHHTHVGPRSGSVSQCTNYACGTDDIKPFNNTRHFPFHLESSSPVIASHASQLGNATLRNHFSSSTPRSSLPHTSPIAFADGTSGSILPPLQVNPVCVDATSVLGRQEHQASFEASQPNFSCQQISLVRPLTDSAQLQQRIGNSVFSHEPERLPIPRHVERTPIAVQALAVPTQSPGSSKRMRINGPALGSLNLGTSSTVTYQAVHPTTAILHDVTPVTRDMEMENLLNSDLPMMQGVNNATHHHNHRPSLRHVVTVPSPSPVSTRYPSSLPRGSDAYRATVPSGSDRRTSFTGPAGGQPSSSNLSSQRNYHASLIMPGTGRSNTSLPLAAARELARHVQQTVQFQAGAVNPHAAGSAVPSLSTSGSIRPPMAEPPQNISQLPPNKNWTPTGRMRGSLTGNAYSAALSQYANPTTPTKPVRPPVPVVPPSESDQNPSSATNVSSQGPAVE